ncbi:phosphatase PAP2 family protein [Comamonas sp. Y33R10-2]|uniref:phosphatase PAP2 family protein n=1 Tax=Comamonas sp. Y33R10-2 TaxID=2853257 RepID=UPI001C5CC059|nr:phosphatase PAP2 family protein [Comamonas sp. Y33R10-2]QXZ08601.1 phosphatase PAP2 family protein [Comamonas sp. Y33R10-2]
MFFFDLFLFALINADAQTPLFSIQLARVLSAWTPNISAALVLLALLFGSPAVRRTMLMLLLSMATAWAITRLIRWGFPAPRPFQLEMGTLWVQHGGRASFPSQHASGAFALAMALALGVTRHRKALVVLGFAAAIGICWSRVHLGVHFPSDVIAGALVGSIGAVIVWNATFWLRRRRYLRAVPHIKKLRLRLRTQ